jgi:hypothetical protein
MSTLRSPRAGEHQDLVFPFLVGNDRDPVNVLVLFPLE